MTALPVVCVSKSLYASSACSSRQRWVKSRSTSTFRSAMNSAHSAWPCFENVHDRVDGEGGFYACCLASAKTISAASMGKQVGSVQNLSHFQFGSARG